MESSPLVSVVVITFNSEKYVIETLESVKAQTFKNIELIISDDGSKDNTVSLVENWIADNKMLFQHCSLNTVAKNTGTSANCNRGVELAKGDWVKIIAGDDILLTNCVEDNLNFSLQFNAKFVCSELVYFREDIEVIDSLRVKMERYYFSLFCRTSHDLRYRFLLRNPTFLNTPTWFICRRDFLRIGGYDQQFRILEDQPFVFRILEAGLSIFTMDKPTVRYRVSAESVSRSPMFRKLIADEKKACFYRYRLPYLKYYNIRDIMSMFDFYATFGTDSPVWSRVFKVVNPMYYNRLFLSKYLF